MQPVLKYTHTEGKKLEAGHSHILASTSQCFLQDAPRRVQPTGDAGFHLPPALYKPCI